MIHRNGRALEHLLAFDYKQKFKIPDIVYKRLALRLAFPLSILLFPEILQWLLPSSTIYYSTGFFFAAAAQLDFEVYASKLVLTVASPDT